MQTKHIDKKATTPTVKEIKLSKFEKALDDKLDNQLLINYVNYQLLQEMKYISMN